jgi:hypothetical protein
MPFMLPSWRHALTPFGACHRDKLNFESKQICQQPPPTFPLLPLAMHWTKQSSAGEHRADNFLIVHFSAGVTEDAIGAATLQPANGLSKKLKSNERSHSWYAFSCASCAATSLADEQHVGARTRNASSDEIR